jgi:MerR family mercuric resistance operon transcriptional regulator
MTSANLAKAMTIGQLAESAGVSVETVRYYQRRGMLAVPSKPMGGHRHYPPEAAKRLAFIRRGQQLGFSLDEIVVLMGLRDGGSCAEGRGHAARKHEELSRRVEELNRMRKRLSAIVRACDGNKRNARCPLIAALEDDG